MTNPISHQSVPYQSPQAEEWRLMTAVERADILSNVMGDLAKLVANSESSTAQATEDMASRVIAHILGQATHLDNSAVLEGATGEFNELYNQARGKTVIIGTENAEKLPIVAQIMAALLAGNQTNFNYPVQEEFAFEVQQIMERAGIDSEVFDLDNANNEEEFNIMLNDHRLAQVGIIGTVEEVQGLSAVLSRTGGILTQVIAITDQHGLSEIFNPDYIHRFCTERVCSINTTAIGGNATLLELGAG